MGAFLAGQEGATTAGAEVEKLKRADAKGNLSNYGGRMKRIAARRGRWYEELELESIYEHRPGRTVSEADNVLFTTMTMNSQSLHLDAEFAARSEFGTRLVNSLFTMATVVGLSVADLTEGTTVANLGFESITFPHPVLIGDTLFAETEVISKRLSKSRTGQGIVLFEHRGLNQRGELVCTARRSALIRCNPE